MNSAAAALGHKGLLILGGPTGAGKSEVALHLAERLGGEIVSVDSMQVYRGMDIGTAKPSPADRARVPHHLLDVVDLSASFNAAQFLKLANQAVEDIRSRGRLPILCGGTGLYFRAFFDGLGPAPAGSPELRAELEAMPLDQLLRELSERDPVCFARIDRRNPRRVIRALEVVRLTGAAYSPQRADWTSVGRSSAKQPQMFGLRRAVEDLDKRIQARVDAMFEQGLVRETEGLLRAGLGHNQTAMQALGYRQVVEYLRGARSLPETISLVKVRTRQFAKRQMTWFRRQLVVDWIDARPQDNAREIADLVAQRWADSQTL